MMTPTSALSLIDSCGSWFVVVVVAAILHVVACGSWLTTGDHSAFVINHEPQTTALISVLI